jgi:hypothetical protein
MSNDVQTLYHRLGQAISVMPDLLQFPIPRKNLDWLGEIDAVVAASGELAAISELRVLSDALHNTEYARRNGAPKIYVLLQRVLRTLEMKLPVGSQGAFISAGNVHDAMVGIGKVLQIATRDLLIIDPYLDEKILSDFVGQASENITIRLLADAKSHKPSFKPAVTRWTAQYKSTRLVEARLAPAGSLHDRLILVDGKEAYVLGQSFKDLAVRAHTSLVRASDDMAREKIRAFEDIWKHAAPL